MERGFAMNTNEFLDNEEMPIHWRHLIYYVLKNWRKIRQGILIGAVAAIIITSIQLCFILLNPESRETLHSDYSFKLSAYNAQVNSLEDKISTDLIALSDQREYNSNSILMKIDPYHKYVANITYYINANYKIMPQSTYQDIDYSTRIMKVYNAYLTGTTTLCKIGRTNT